MKHNRTTLFYFAGSSRFHNLYYSRGVRQRVFAAFHDRPGFLIEDGIRQDMPQDMRESVFCLSPLGSGWGLRIVDAMLCGCIPVVVQDGILQPGDDVLPYHDFAVRIPEEKVDEIEEILRAIPPKEIRRLQRGVKKYARFFLWEPPDGLAYQLVLQSLRRQLHLIQGVFLRETRAFEVDDRFATPRPAEGWPEDRRRRRRRRGGRRALAAPAAAAQQEEEEVGRHWSSGVAEEGGFLLPLD